MLVTTLCRSRAAAEETVAWLRARGYRNDELGLAMYDSPALAAVMQQVPEEQAMRHALPLSGTGAGISVAAAFAGIALTLGPLGFAASGPMALLLAAIGALSAGGIVGMLEGAGIPDNDVERYADELKHGGVLISVTPHEGDEEEVRRYFSERS